MALGTFTFETERTAMLAKARGRGGVHTFRQIQGLMFFLCPQRGQHALRRERRLMQTDSNCIINRICDRGNGCGKRSFTAFLGAKWTFGIDTLYDDGFHFGRFHR